MLNSETFRRIIGRIFGVDFSGFTSLELAAIAENLGVEKEFIGVILAAHVEEAFSKFDQFETAETKAKINEEIKIIDEILDEVDAIPVLVNDTHTISDGQSDGVPICVD